MIEGGVNWPLSPQAQQLHNGASLGKQVTLQTGPTGDKGVCMCACQKEKRKLTVIDSKAGKKKVCMCEREQCSVGSVLCGSLSPLVRQTQSWVDLGQKFQGSSVSQTEGTETVTMATIKSLFFPGCLCHRIS